MHIVVVVVGLAAAVVPDPENEAKHAPQKDTDRGPTAVIESAAMLGRAAAVDDEGAGEPAAALA